jgi:glutathione S-transferase
MNMILFQFPTACSRVTLNALEETGADYETRLVNLHNNQQKSPEYLAVNPKGKVPALSIDGHLMTENSVILNYLDQQYPAAQLLPKSSDPVQAMQPHTDMAWCAATLHPIVRQIRNPQRYTQGETGGIRADGIEKMNKECAIMDQRLSGGRWWYGSEWSILDTYIYWAYSTAGKGAEFELDRFQALAEHAARVRQRPAFIRTLECERSSLIAAGLEVPPDL